MGARVDGLVAGGVVVAGGEGEGASEKSQEGETVTARFSWGAPLVLDMEVNIRN